MGLQENIVLHYILRYIYAYYERFGGTLLRQCSTLEYSNIHESYCTHTWAYSTAKPRYCEAMQDNAELAVTIHDHVSQGYQLAGQSAQHVLRDALDGPAVQC
jgi:hypothetical protein